MASALDYYRKYSSSSSSSGGNYSSSKTVSASTVPSSQTVAPPSYDSGGSMSSTPIASFPSDAPETGVASVAGGGTLTSSGRIIASSSEEDVGVASTEGGVITAGGRVVSEDLAAGSPSSGAKPSSPAAEAEAKTEAPDAVLEESAPEGEYVSKVEEGKVELPYSKQVRSVNEGTVITDLDGQKYVVVGGELRTYTPGFALKKGEVQALPVGSAQEEFMGYGKNTPMPAFLKGATKIAESGYGTGKVSFWLSKDGTQVISVDAYGRNVGSSSVTQFFNTKEVEKQRALAKKISQTSGAEQAAGMSLARGMLPSEKGEKLPGGGFTKGGKLGVYNTPTGTGIFFRKGETEDAPVDVVGGESPSRQMSLTRESAILAVNPLLFNVEEARARERLEMQQTGMAVSRAFQAPAPTGGTSVASQAPVNSEFVRDITRPRSPLPQFRAGEPTEAFKRYQFAKERGMSEENLKRLGTPLVSGIEPNIRAFQATGMAAAIFRGQEFARAPGGTIGGALAAGVFAAAAPEVAVPLFGLMLGGEAVSSFAKEGVGGVGGFAARTAVDAAVFGAVYPVAKPIGLGIRSGAARVSSASKAFVEREGQQLLMDWAKYSSEQYLYKPEGFRAIRGNELVLQAERGLGRALVPKGSVKGAPEAIFIRDVAKYRATSQPIFQATEYVPVRLQSGAYYPALVENIPVAKGNVLTGVRGGQVVVEPSAFTSMFKFPEAREPTVTRTTGFEKTLEVSIGKGGRPIYVVEPKAAEYYGFLAEEAYGQKPASYTRFPLDVKSGGKYTSSGQLVLEPSAVSRFRPLDVETQASMRQLSRFALSETVGRRGTPVSTEGSPLFDSRALSERVVEAPRTPVSEAFKRGFELQKGVAGFGERPAYLRGFGGVDAKTGQMFSELSQAAVSEYGSFARRAVVEAPTTSTSLLRYEPGSKVALDLARLSGEGRVSMGAEPFNYRNPVFFFEGTTITELGVLKPKPAAVKGSVSSEFLLKGFEAGKKGEFFKDYFGAVKESPPKYRYVEPPSEYLPESRVRTSTLQALSKQAESSVFAEPIASKDGTAQVRFFKIGRTKAPTPMFRESASELAGRFVPVEPVADVVPIKASVRPVAIPKTVSKAPSFAGFVPYLPAASRKVLREQDRQLGGALERSTRVEFASASVFELPKFEPRVSDQKGSVATRFAPQRSITMPPVGVVADKFKSPERFVSPPVEDVATRFAPVQTVKQPSRQASATLPPSPSAPVPVVPSPSFAPRPQPRPVPDFAPPDTVFVPRVVPPSPVFSRGFQRRAPPAKRQVFGRPTRYTPSLSAAFLGIKARREPSGVARGVFSGLEVRPVVVPRRKSKKKRKRKLSAEEKRIRKSLRGFRRAVGGL